MSNLKELRNQVLKQIYELSNGSSTRSVAGFLPEAFPDVNNVTLLSILAYLKDKGLIELQVRQYINGEQGLQRVCITNLGIDKVEENEPDTPKMPNSAIMGFSNCGTLINCSSSIIVNSPDSKTENTWSLADHQEELLAILNAVNAGVKNEPNSVEIIKAVGEVIGKVEKGTVTHSGLKDFFMSLATSVVSPVLSNFIQSGLALVLGC